MQLFINGQPSGVTSYRGPLHPPPRTQDGDLTFGCGMFGGVAADPCRCLISEARVTEASRHPREWLWSPDWRDANVTVRARP